MKRILIALSLVVLTAGWDTASHASASVPCTRTLLTKIYVRQNEAIPPTILTPLVLAGEYNIVPGGSSILTIAIKNSRMPFTDTRTARNEWDVPIVANTTYQLESDVIPEN